jgi:hypothetical protein
MLIYCSPNSCSGKIKINLVNLNLLRDISDFGFCHQDMTPPRVTAGGDGLEVYRRAAGS